MLGELVLPAESKTESLLSFSSPDLDYASVGKQFGHEHSVPVSLRRETGLFYLTI